jgi:hypothetical protein
MADETVTFKVTGADGKVTDVVVPQTAVLEAVKESHVPKDRIEADLARRVASMIKNGGYVKQDELLDNAEFAGRVAEKHGFTKGTAGGDDAAAKQLKDAIARAMADLDTKTIKPLTEKLAAGEKREKDLRLRDRERQILQAATDAGIKKPLLKAATKGKAAPIVAMLEDAYVEYNGDYVVSDGKDGYVLSTSRDPEQTYKSIAEHVAEWAADPANADFVDPTGQRGATVGGGGKGGKAVAGEIIMTHEEASDGTSYAAALAKVGGDHSKIRVRSQQAF